MNLNPTVLQNFSDDELLRYVDRSHPQVDELARCLERVLEKAVFPDDEVDEEVDGLNFEDDEADFLGDDSDD